MGRGYIYIGLVFLLVLSLSTTASDLSVEKNEMDINVFKNSESTFYLDIHNEMNSTFYDVQVRDLPYFDFPVINNITKNETINYTFDVFVNKTIDKDYNSKLVWFNKEYLETDNSTYDVNITSDGFEPDHIDMDGNDKVVFHNRKSSDETILLYESGSDFSDLTPKNFEITVPAGGQKQFIVPDVSSYDFIGYYLFESQDGFIEFNITNKTKLQKVHYSEQEIPLTFKVKAKYPEANLNVDTFTTRFEVDYNGYVDGVMQIKAVDNPVYDINLDMKWTEFSSNNFDLAKGQSKIITFTIEPDIDKTKQTNKTYDFDLTTTSKNTPKYTNLVKVDVPYQYLGDEDEEEDKTKIIKVFDEEACYDYCEEYPEKCPLQTKTKIEYRMKEQNVTLTDKQINQIISENQRLRNKIESQAQKIGGLKDSLTDFQDNIKGDISYIKSEQEEENRKEQGRNISFALILLGVFFIGCILGLFIYVPKLFRKIKTKKMKNHGVY